VVQRQITDGHFLGRAARCASRDAPLAKYKIHFNEDEWRTMRFRFEITDTYWLKSFLARSGQLLLMTAIALPCAGQSIGFQPSETSSSSISRAHDGQGFTLHVTTREVLVEVVARDRSNRPITDLKLEDFQVFEGTHKDSTSIRRVTGLRVVDPDSEEEEGNVKPSLTVLPLGGRCEIRSALHYVLAFHPEGWAAGIHTVRVVVKRKHVSLSYRSQFYVGVEEVAQRSAREPVTRTVGNDAELMRAACYHPDIPPSIPLSITGDEHQATGSSRYVLTIASNSLDLAGINGKTNQVHLEYGICSFSRSGRILGYWESSVDKPLEAAELAAIMDTGWTEELNIPRHKAPALTRLVVREPQSGNLGLVDVSEGSLGRAQKASPSGTPARHRLFLPVDPTARAGEYVGGHLLLGSPVPTRNSLCGDVYELPQTTMFLPEDFKALNAVGALYTTSLSVPERILPQGLPGSTPRSDWFGVDYYGEFWVTKPGKYEFVLSADDGADLYIDERRIIDDDGIHPPQTVSGSVNLAAGRHTIHLPYFQGPTYVSLVLRVQPPDGILDTFDLRDYARPSSLLSH
jgi:hypothetical protein